MERVEPNTTGLRSSRYYAAAGWTRMAGQMQHVEFSPNFLLLCSQADDWYGAENDVRELIQRDLVRLLFCYSAVDCLVRFHTPDLRDGSSILNTLLQLVREERGTPLLHSECILHHLKAHLGVMDESDRNKIGRALAGVGRDSYAEVCANVGVKIRHAFAHGSFGWDPGRWVVSNDDGWAADPTPAAHLVQAGIRCLLLTLQTLLAIAHRKDLVGIEVDDLPERNEIWMDGAWRETLGVQEWIACAHLRAEDGPEPPE